MKKCIKAALVLAGAFMAFFPANGLCENLIENGGFEVKASETLPEGWKLNVSRKARAETVFDATEKHSGDFSYRISVDPPGGRAVLYIDEAATGTVIPGKTYEATFWAKTENLDYNRFHEAPAFRINYAPQRARPGGVIDLMAKLAGRSGWTQLTVQAPEAPQNSDRIHIDVIITQGTLWIDDIQVRQVE
ncbi:MAG: hypothetical protein KGY42_00550 [Desulfobacterales bacterium]|nr:hypothetical protein [Desulfobacterales bacterium]MBS3754170.1 hypothetical protein [Desulfobacterales bacterium]